jgi:hypothetical protein
MALVTVNWPASLLSPGSFLPPNLPGVNRGLSPLTPNANNQSVVDTSVFPLAMLLAAGFSVAPGIGITSARPTSALSPGLMFFDQSLGYPVYVKSLGPTVWVNGAGTVV